MKHKIVINKSKFNIIVERLSHQLIENHGDFKETVLIGIQPRGIHLCNRIYQKLSSLLSNQNIKIGNLDITFYRDDFRRRQDPLEPQTIDIDFSIEGKHVILIDDVLYTGRSVRAAMDALMAFGRPKSVELTVFIDRRFSRHLPIQPNYVGQKVDTIASEKVIVEFREMKTLSREHLLGIKYLTKEDISLIFKTADNFKRIINQPIKKVPSLRDITVANLFFENSTRTKLSFELAEKRLSADVINFSSGASSVKKGETLIDTVNNILAMKVDMVVMRHPNPGASVFLSRNIDAKIINAGDGTHEHPTQALLDAYSIREKYGEVKDKKIVIIGDILHSRVALSNIYCLQKLGAQVRVCGPSTLIPRFINQLGVKHISNLREALDWCEIANVLRIQLERQDIKYLPSLREYAMVFGINKELLMNLDKEITIMHPGPINRGIELTSDVADSGQSIILEQVENGVAIRMAALYLLAGNIKKNGK